jgi:GntR family transcriptional regulator
MAGMATVAGVIDIDVHSAVPSYRQLAAILAARIGSGEIAAGEALPSITALTGETGLAVTTVRKAIALLVADGVAHTVPGRATYAGPRPD